MANNRLQEIYMKIVSINLLLKVNIALSDSTKGIRNAETVILIVMNRNIYFAIFTNFLTSASSSSPILFGVCNPESIEKGFSHSYEELCFKLK